MTDHIKLCPHCGGEAALHANYSYKTRSYFVMCKCGMCGSQGKIYNSPDNPESEEWNNIACIDAIKAWNMRYKEGA